MYWYTKSGMRGTGGTDISNVPNLATADISENPNVFGRGDSAGNTYAVTLRSIAPKDATDFSWVTDTDYVFKAIEKYKENTRKNILNALIVVLPKDSEEFKTYTNSPVGAHHHTFIWETVQKELFYH